MKLSTLTRIHRSQTYSIRKQLNPQITDIESLAQLEAAMADSAQGPVVLFKHSTACGLSKRAHREIDQLDLPSDPPVFRVVVQSARMISDEIARRFRIRHESPQVIVVSRGLSVFDSSHRGVTAVRIRNAVAKAA